MNSYPLGEDALAPETYLFKMNTANFLCEALYIVQLENQSFSIEVFLNIANCMFYKMARFAG